MHKLSLVISHDVHIETNEKFFVKSNPVSPRVSLRLRPSQLKFSCTSVPVSPKSLQKLYESNKKFQIVKKTKQISQSNCEESTIQHARSFEVYSDIKKSYLGIYYEGFSIIRADPDIPVQKAICKRTNSVVAIKSCQKQNGASYKSLKQELLILSKLSHKNIVKFIEHFETNDSFYIVMEYIQGQTLFQHLKAQPLTRCSENQVKKIFVQILSAIEYLHSNNFTHSDLKLGNILIDFKGNIKIIDFGLSSSSKKLIKSVCGTENYFSPEITLAQEYFGPPADVWALGVVLFALVTGTFPFRAVNSEDLYKKIQKGISGMPDYLSRECKKVLSKMMRVDPKLRPIVRQLRKEKFFSEDSLDND